MDGVLKACEAPGAVGRTINVATGGRISLNDLYRELCRLTGASGEPVYADARPGDVKHSQADITLASALLGYSPHVSFADGLGRTLEWYKASGREER